MTEYTDNLIAEARTGLDNLTRWALKYADELPSGTVKAEAVANAGHWNGAVLAALDAVQPVTPAETTRDIAIIEAALQYRSDVPWPSLARVIEAARSSQPVTPDRAEAVRLIRGVLHPDATRNFPMADGYAHRIFDALLASGVLGQPQPQPDRKALIDALVTGVEYPDGEIDHWSTQEAASIVDALLPLLGQPRTDAPLDLDPYPWRDRDGRKHAAFGPPVHLSMHGSYWSPGPEFEQDQARYPRTDTTEPGDANG